MSEVRLSLIVAAAENGVIGRNNKLPWHLRSDLQYFKRITMGKPILMGRKTFESIGRPLPGRSNIVISRNPDYHADGVTVVTSLDQALALAQDIALIDGGDELMVIGGAQIYAEAMGRAERIYLTLVHGNPAGDACLPAIDSATWRQLSGERFVAGEGDDFDYSLLVYERC